MNAKDLTEFHYLVNQFQSEMSLKDICSQEGGIAVPAWKLVDMFVSLKFYC